MILCIHPSFGVVLSAMTGKLSRSFLFYLNIYFSVNMPISAYL